MKKENKTVKAIVVVVIVGIGLLHNLNKQSFLYKQLEFAAVNKENYTEKTDSLPLKGNKLFIYTIKITNSAIQHLISGI